MTACLPGDYDSRPPPPGPKPVSLLMEAVMDHYAVIGHPVAHSLSPRIHARFAQRCGEALDYRAVEAPLDDFAGTVRALFAEGLAGANVTVPFKAEARELADRLDPVADRAGVVNTLRREPDGSLSGFNTDGTGLVRDLSVHLGVALEGARVVLIGAGGAAAGVVEPLCRAGIGELVIGNRTAARAEALAARFETVGPVRAAAMAELPAADLVINATAASLAGELPALPDGLILPGTLAYDMMYADAGTPFLDWCRARGAGRRADGLGMLVEQAAEAFLIWRGIRPDATDVLRLLRPRAVPF